MALSFAEKLNQLGLAGVDRLGRAWADPEITMAAIAERFGLKPPDLEELKLLLGQRVGRPARITTWRQSDDKRNARSRKYKRAAR